MKSDQEVKAFYKEIMLVMKASIRSDQLLRDHFEDYFRLFSACFPHLPIQQSPLNFMSQQSQMVASDFYDTSESDILHQAWVEEADVTQIIDICKANWVP